MKTFQTWTIGVIASSASSAAAIATDSALLARHPWTDLPGGFMALSGARVPATLFTVSAIVIVSLLAASVAAHTLAAGTRLAGSGCRMLMRSRNLAA